MKSVKLKNYAKTTAQTHFLPHLGLPLLSRAVRRERDALRGEPRARCGAVGGCDDDMIYGTVCHVMPRYDMLLFIRIK